MKILCFLLLLVAQSSWSLRHSIRGYRSSVGKRRSLEQVVIGLDKKQKKTDNDDNDGDDYVDDDDKRTVGSPIAAPVEAPISPEFSPVSAPAAPTKGKEKKEKTSKDESDGNEESEEDNETNTADNSRTIGGEEDSDDDNGKGKGKVCKDKIDKNGNGEKCPSSAPSATPSGSSAPSLYPSMVVSHEPSLKPSMQPSAEPSLEPSSGPSMKLSESPSSQPSIAVDGVDGETNNREFKEPLEEEVVGTEPEIIFENEMSEEPPVNLTEFERDPDATTATTTLTEREPVEGESEAPQDTDRPPIEIEGDDEHYNITIENLDVKTLTEIVGMEGVDNPDAVVTQKGHDVHIVEPSDSGGVVKASGDADGNLNTTGDGDGDGSENPTNTEGSESPWPHEASPQDVKKVEELEELEEIKSELDKLEEEEALELEELDELKEEVAEARAEMDMAPEVMASSARISSPLDSNSTLSNMTLTEDNSTSLNTTAEEDTSLETSESNLISSNETQSSVSNVTEGVDANVTDAPTEVSPEEQYVEDLERTSGDTTLSLTEYNTSSGEIGVVESNVTDDLELIFEVDPIDHSMPRTTPAASTPAPSPMKKPTGKSSKKEKKDKDGNGSESESEGAGRGQSGVRVVGGGPKGKSKRHGSSDCPHCAERPGISNPNSNKR